MTPVWVDWIRNGTLFSILVVCITALVRFGRMEQKITDVMYTNQLIRGDLKQISEDQAVIRDRLTVVEGDVKHLYK
jgi:hypothetical protein